MVLALVAVIVGFRLIEEIGPERRAGDRFVVARVLDGDTIELAGGDRLRLLAIDTPEAGQPLHEEAESRLGSLCLGKTIRIEFADRRRDRYGRLLGFVWVDSVFLNEAILREGLGYLYLFKDGEADRPQVARLLRAQQAALAQGVGIWALESDPEDYYVRAEGSFRFHRPGCRSVAELGPERRQVFQSRREALMIGLSPCRNCRP
jgi:micrococcal nuclease